MLVVLFGCGSSSGKAYAIKATVSGLKGSGLELWVNGHDPVQVERDGEVTLAYMVSGYYYSVSVKTQPTSPAQTCAVDPVDKATGTMGSADVTNVTVTCVTTYGIGGTVSGLEGTGLVLNNRLGDDTVGEDLPITDTGSIPFAFPTRAVTGAEYTVTAKTQPTDLDQTCSVGNATGIVGSTDVANVTVKCSTEAYSVGGTITGLVSGTKVTLRNNGTDFTEVTGSGMSPESFVFLQEVADGATYQVEVETQPTNPWQTCTVTNGTGTIAYPGVSNVSVSCTINTYAVGGSVSGLIGSGLVLTTNGQNVTVSVDSTVFIFAEPLASGTNYEVTVANQPTNPDQVCTVTNGSGTVGGAVVADVQVVCKGLWTSVAAGGNHSVAVKIDGTLWAWGGNYHGQLGDNSTTDRYLPVTVLNAAGNAPLSGVAAVAAGYSHTCALVNGGVQCWGLNNDGQLGDNSVTNRHLPVTVLNASGNAPLSGVTAIAAGYANTCALTTEGGVYCWGNNGGGQLGNNSTTRSLVPVAVLNPSGSAPLSGATNVAAGGGYACSLMSGGGVQCWGSNYLGRLGNDSTTDSHVSAQVSGMTSGAIAIATGGGHTCALMNDSSVQCWGSNGNGQLGNDSTTESYIPIAVLNSSGNAYLNGVTAIASGGGHTCTLADGGVQCWGYNGYGQLGNDSTTESHVPVSVQF